VGGQDAACAVGDCDLGPRYLTVAALAAQLSDCLDQEQQAEHAGVAVGQTTPGGVEGKLPTRPDPATRNKISGRAGGGRIPVLPGLEGR
jgi:hypothetical protein